MAPPVIPALRSLWWGDVKIQVRVQRNFEGAGTEVYSVFIMIMIPFYVKVCVSEGGRVYACKSTLNISELYSITLGFFVRFNFLT